MSHFSVGVITKTGDEAEIEKLLKPYDEEINPNGKWDWYNIGGRWSDKIKTKNGLETNTALIKQIDFSLDPKIMKEAEHFWNVVVDETVEDKEVFAFYKPEYYTRLYGTKENYVKESASFSTYALLTHEGEWIEPGEMGMFGLSTETAETKKQYIETFNEIMNKYKDYYLTIVDCHI